MNVGDPCWRDAAGAAAMELPWRVMLPDGTTRTDPSQWGEDADVLAATGWQRSALTSEDIAALSPAAPEPPGWTTPGGWKISTSPESLSLLAGLYVLAARREQLMLSPVVTLTDTNGGRHPLNFADFDAIMVALGEAMESLHDAA